MSRAQVRLFDYQEDLLQSLRRIMRAVDLYSRRLFTDHGLSGPQLLCLRQLNANGAMLTGQLARAVSLSAATVCGILDRLEARELVRRERQTDDKRRVLVKLTAKGRQVARKAPPSLETGFLEQLAALPLSEQAELDRALKKIVSMMSVEDLDAAAVFASDTAIAGYTKPSRVRKPV